MSDSVHVHPVQDLVEHDTDSDNCVCIPDIVAVKRDDGSVGWVVTHHSLDGREHLENADHTPNEEDS